MSQEWNDELEIERQCAFFWVTLCQILIVKQDLRDPSLVDEAVEVHWKRLFDEHKDQSGPFMQEAERDFSKWAKYFMENHDDPD